MLFLIGAAMIIFGLADAASPKGTWLSVYVALVGCTVLGLGCR